MSYKTGTSTYHVSCFILLYISTFSFLRKGKFNSKTVLLLLFFFVSQFLVAYFFGIAPLHRFLSGLVWFGGLLIVYSQGRFINCDPKLIFKCLILTAFVSVFIGLIQYHVFYIDRPKAFFTEPSTAGLFFFSMALAIVFILANFKLKFRYTILSVAFLVSLFYIGILTKSMHFITFILSLTILYLLIYYNKILSIFSTKYLLKLFGLGILLIPVIFLLINFIDLDHISRRLMFLDAIDSSSLSTLSWLRGLDQALASISMSPFFGLGLGSTGYFDFYSAYSSELQRQNVGYLNLTDAYSLAFRLITEIGILFVCLFAHILFKKIISFKKYIIFTKGHINFETISTQFIFVFSISIIIGCLIKEPLYPQSFLYVAVFILSSVKLENVSKPVYDWVKQKYILQS